MNPTTDGSGEAPGREDFSLVIPVHNQADHVERVIGDYVGSLEASSYTFEIVPVVNASVDASEEIVRGLASRDGRIRPIVTPTPGWGHAVRAGLASARGRLLCYTNSSRTTGQDVLAVCAAHDSGTLSVAKAHRQHRGGALRILGSSMYNVEARFLFGVTSPDVNGTPKVFQRELLDRVKLTESGDLVDLELLFQCARLGVPVKNVALESRARFGGRSTTTLKSAARMLGYACFKPFAWKA